MRPCDDKGLKCTARSGHKAVERFYLYKPKGLALESVMPRAAVKQNPLLQFVSNGSLVVQILIGLVAGVVLALLSPTSASWVGIVGDLFVNALKAEIGRSACRERGCTTG